MVASSSHLRSIFGAFSAIGYSAGVLQGQQLKAINHGHTEKGGSVRPDSHSIFEIGSLTKLFTALLFCDLKTRGVLDFDDPVNAYLPSKVRVPNHEGKEVTLLHLATHASGLPRMPYRHFVRRDDGQHPFSRFSVEDAYRFLDEVKLESHPGSKYAYSNFGYALLGHVLELASGADYQELVRTRICIPLAMEDTSIDLTAEQKRRFCHGYSMQGAPKTRRRLEFMGPAGGLRSSVDDLAKSLRQAAADPGSGLSGMLKSCMVIRRRWPVDFISKLQSEPGFQDLQSAGVGLGWHVYSLRGRNFVWHSGGTRGFSSFIGLETLSKTGVVLLTNTNGDITDVGVRALSLAFA
ncbi:MAG: serine hydrolase domain-containing protein [Nitrososphaerales archaeon]